MRDPRRHSGHNKKTNTIDIGIDDSPQDEIMMRGIKFDEDQTVAAKPEEIIGKHCPLCVLTGNSISQ